MRTLLRCWWRGIEFRKRLFADPMADPSTHPDISTGQGAIGFGTVPPMPPRRAFLDPLGGPLPWLIVALELATFSIVFLAIALLQRSNPTAFATGRSALSAPVGLAMTLLLLTSGALVANGVHAFRCNHLRAARVGFVAGAALGGVFVVLKGLDYWHHAALGHSLGTDLFWDTYVLATAFHLLHVLVGIVVLLGAVRAIGHPALRDPETSIVGPALFWHMCDVVWFFLWPLFYVAPA